MPLRNVADRRNPYLATTQPSRDTTTITIGAETGNVINVAVQLKNARNRNLAAATRVRLRLCADALGLTALVVPPTDGVYAGTVGALAQGTDHLRDGLIVKGGLAIDAVPEKFKTTATLTGRLKGVTFTKAAATAIAFSAAHVVAAAKYGIALVQCTAAGVVSTKVPAATATTPMTYASAALALAALPLPDLGNIALGYITLDNSASDGSSTGAWVAQTDDMTNTSDITAAAFVDATEQIGPVTFDAVSDATGAFNFNIKDTTTPTMYLAITMPDGRQKMSGAITFA